MQVRLGCKNRLTNLLFNTQEAFDKKNNSLINKTTLEKIIQLSFGFIENYEIFIDEKFENSQFIIIEHNGIKKYILFSYEQPNETRNGYILTKTPVAFRKFVIDTTSNDKKFFEICLLDINKEIYIQKKGKKYETYKTEDLNIDSLRSSGSINSYNIFAYKLLKTCNIRILNEFALPFKKFQKENKLKQKQYIQNEIQEKIPFISVEELKLFRQNLGKANSGNKSSYIIETEDLIVIYGKTFGNNGFEVTMIACALAELAKSQDKEIFLYQIKDNLGVDGIINKDAKPISSENLELLKKINIKVYDELQDYEKNPESIIDDKKDSRNQLEFMKNLMIKWGEKGKEDIKKCYLCNCTIQKTIIASHIQRVCDINNLEIPFEEKRKKAVDGNNGFWLCANHDKMFEYGIITFNENTGKLELGHNYLNTEELTQVQVNYIQEITKKLFKNT